LTYGPRFATPLTDKVAGSDQHGRRTVRQPATTLLDTPHGVQLECVVTGSGDPVTVFAHGLGNGIAETRPLGSAVAGRRVFFQFRGHGRSGAPPGRWTYADLARDLRAVADLTGATRAVGVSLGAGALCRLLADDPTRFTRVVVFLPAVLDVPRAAPARLRLDALWSAIESRDPASVARVIAEEVPSDLRHSAAAASFIQQRVDQLLRDGLGAGLAGLPDQVPVEDRTLLTKVAADALVIGCRGDDLHPSAVAEDVAHALPHATLHVYDEPAVLWTRRADLRDRVAGFLNAPD